MNFNLKRQLKGSYFLRFLTWAGFLNFVDLLAMALPVRREEKRKKRVVFARLDGLGDYMIWSSTFPAIAEIYPSVEYERILVLNERWRSLADDVAEFDRKIFVNPSKLILDPVYRFKTMRTIRSLGADIFVNPKLTREFLWVDSLVRCSGAQIRIGCRGFDNLMTGIQERISNRWYTTLADPPKADDHELESSFRFLKTLDPATRAVPTIAASGDLEARNIAISGDYALLFLGAQTADRRWPIEKFGEVAEFLCGRFGMQIVLCGGPGEEFLVSDFKQAYNGDFIDMIGKTDLPGLNSLIGSAALIVTNDTGAGHIAAFSRRPTVVITPGNQVGRFFPYPESLQARGVRQVSVFHEMPCFGCGWTCIYRDLSPGQPKPCIAGVEVKNVIASIEGLMSEPERVHRRKERVMPG